MKIFQALTKSEDYLTPFVLTLGNFDGVHIGHQLILSTLKETAKKQKAFSSVLTFSNHPSTILHPSIHSPLLCTYEHKVRLLEAFGIDYLFSLPFTKEFSQQSAESFLLKLKQAIPLKALILGSDARIGEARKGDQTTVIALAKQLGFDAQYIEDHLIKGQRVSSSRIRTMIQQGNFRQAEKLLGRAYSIYSAVIKGNTRGASIGYPTANVAVDKLCLPPLGVYAVTLIHQGIKHAGIANLGVAPTIGLKNSPALEVHLFDKNLALYGEFVEVIFLSYIRPEKCFDSVNQLKEQIAQDIIKAKNL
jgi:riboflavin kinase/FMN adenylyltransferase